MTFTPGENVGPYRIIEQLGQGGMATVFRAYHPSLDRDVAIKVLHPVFKEDPQFFGRFQREARIVARLEHSNIIPVYDFNEHNGEPYLVMRYVKGDTLKAHLGQGPWPPAEVLRLMRPVCSALAYAHSQGVLHRDIKPSNIMLTHDGNVFLTDFGLARMTQAGASTMSQDMMVGTPQYISPEQAQGVAELDGRTDIYSLGVVLFEMLVGSVPFSADTPFAIVHDHIYSPLPLPRSLNPNLDEAVERTLLKALAKEPGERFSSVEAFLASMEDSLGAQIGQAPTVASSRAPESSPAPAPPARQRNALWPWLGGAATLLVVVGLIALLALFARRQRADTSPPAAPAGQVGQPGQPAPPAAPDPLEEARALQARGDEFLRQEKPEAALEAYNRAIQTAPAYLPPYYSAGWLLLQGQRPDEGLAQFEAAVAADPDNPEPWFQLARARVQTGDAEGAHQAIQQALALAPDFAPAHAGLARYYLFRGEVERAKEEIDLAFELDSGSPDAHLANALYLLETGDRRGAVRELGLVLRSNPVSPLTRSEARRLAGELGLPLPDEPVGAD